MTKTEGQTLEAVLPLLGEAYGNWKTWQEAKDTHKDAFFELADAALNRSGLEIRLVEYVSASGEAALARCQRHHPGWMIDVQRPHRIKADHWEFVLRADPSLMPYTIEAEGVKYGRQISKGPVMLDDEWLAEADPELYAEVTFELPWGDRVVVPIDRLDADLLGRLTPYMYNGKPRVSLAAPREVKVEV